MVERKAPPPSRPADAPASSSTAAVEEPREALRRAGAREAAAQETERRFQERKACWVRRIDYVLNRECKRIQAKTIQNQWASWTRYGNKLRAHGWEPLRAVFGYKGRQAKAKAGPVARGSVPYE